MVAAAAPVLKRAAVGQASCLPLDTTGRQDACPTAATLRGVRSRRRGGASGGI